MPKLEEIATLTPLGEASRSGEVYERLRLSIVTGELRPNEPLIESDLAEKLGISRTPIRESIQRLAAHGLIVPRKRGWAVREFSAMEIQENYEARACLEGMAARYAAERGSDEEIAYIASIDAYRQAIQNPSKETRVRTNREFHDAIIAAAKNNRLKELIFSAGNFYLNRRVASQTNEDQFRRAQVEHKTIVGAILRRDGDAAEKAMREHIMRSFHTWRELNGLD